MNSEQARDLFSSYLEGTLEPALRQQLERALEVNPALNQEFREFKAVCHALSESANEDISIPGHLNARISAVLDDSLAAKPATNNVLQLFHWKPLAIGAAAAIALVTAGVTLFSPNSGASVAGIIPSGNTIVERAELSWANDQLTLRYQSPKEDKLLLREGQDGEVWSTVAIGTNLTTEKIQNPTDGPRLVELDVASTENDRLIVLPGPAATGPIVGSGSTIDLAKQIAARYQTPVEILRLDSPSAEIEWNLPESEDVVDLAANLRDLGISISKGENGILTLGQ
ncbi:MAG: hypothetical protein KF812_07770 [Fimbriimonadaceae bacterium]|nr:hypothetical protein [Fimbriimonadaceae bacterium]